MYQSIIRNKKNNSKFNTNKKNDYILSIDEEFAYVLKLLGNCRVNLISNSGNEHIGVIRGSLRKFNNRILIEKGDIIVISKRDFQNNKVDIVHKYNREQTSILINNGQLSNVLINYYNDKFKSNYDNDTYNANIEFNDNGNIISTDSSDNDNDNDNDNDSENDDNNKDIDNITFKIKKLNKYL